MVDAVPGDVGTKVVPEVWAFGEDKVATEVVVVVVGPRVVPCEEVLGSGPGGLGMVTSCCRSPWCCWQFFPVADQSWLPS